MNKKITLERVIRHICKTWKNKLCALMMIAFGIISIKLTGNGTGMLFLMLFIIPLLVSKENIISRWG